VLAMSKIFERVSMCLACGSWFDPPRCCKKYNLHRTKPVKYQNVHMNASSVVVSATDASPVDMGSNPGSSVFSLDF